MRYGMKPASIFSWLLRSEKWNSTILSYRYGGDVLERKYGSITLAFATCLLHYIVCFFLEVEVSPTLCVHGKLLKFVLHIN